MERLGEVTQELKHKLARLSVGRFLQARAKGNFEQAAAFAQTQNWIDRGEIVLALKTATGDTGTDDFPSSRNSVAEAFLGLERPLSIPMRLLEGKPSVPMRTNIFANTQGIVAVQVAEGARIPILRGNWDVTQLEPRKIGAVTVQPRELVENASNDAQLALADELVVAMAKAENRAFVSPNEDGSVLDGAPSFASTGSAVANVDADLRTLVALVPGADRPGCAFVMRATTAVFLATLRGSGGAAAYPDLSPGQNGTLLKLPVFVSDACEFDDSPATGFIGLLDPSGIVWNQGDLVLTTSTNAALVMDDDSAAVSNPVSLFQAEAIAFKALRRVAWFANVGAGAFYTCSY